MILLSFAYIYIYIYMRVCVCVCVCVHDIYIYIYIYIYKRYVYVFARVCSYVSYMHSMKYPTKRIQVLSYIYIYIYIYKVLWDSVETSVFIWCKPGLTYFSSFLPLQSLLLRITHRVKISMHGGFCNSTVLLNTANKTSIFTDDGSVWIFNVTEWILTAFSFII